MSDEGKNTKSKVSPKSGQVDRRIRRTKRLMIQALTVLMQRKQISEITVTELAELADVNRSTFYAYFNDIYDMVEQIQIDLFKQLDEIITLHDDETVTQQTRPILLDLFRFIKENQEMCRLLLSPNGDMNFLHRLNEVLRRKCLHVYQAAEPAADEKDFDYHYSYIVFGCAGIIRAWVYRNCPESPDEMAEMTNRMILNGGIS